MSLLLAGGKLMRQTGLRRKCSRGLEKRAGLREAALTTRKGCADRRTTARPSDMKRSVINLATADHRRTFRPKAGDARFGPRARP